MTKLEEFKEWQRISRLRYILLDRKLNPEDLKDAARLIFNNVVNKKISAQIRLEILSVLFIYTKYKDEMTKEKIESFDIYTVSDDEIFSMVERVKKEERCVYHWGRFVKIEREIKIKRFLRFVKKLVKR